MLSTFPFFRLELDFFHPEFRLMIYDTGSPMGPGVLGSINSISSAINGPQPGIGRESCLAAPAEPAATPSCGESPLLSLARGRLGRED